MAKNLNPDISTPVSHADSLNMLRNLLAAISTTLDTLSELQEVVNSTIFIVDQIRNDLYLGNPVLLDEEHSDWDGPDLLNPYADRNKLQPNL